MSDSSPPTGRDLMRMARQHLESLKAAGVEWLPIAPPAEAPETEAPPAASDHLSAGEGFRSSTKMPAGEENTESMAKASSPKTLTLPQRRTELQTLAERISVCTRCPELAATRTQTVFGDGPPGVELCFVGEAPGADEDAQGLPFVGAAGQLLNRIIAACGMKREEVYICNIIKCRPPGNRTPLASEAANCREYLERQLELVRPKFICALGSCAAQNLLGTTQAIGRLRGRFHDYRGIPVICTYHPAYLLPHRSPQSKKLVWEDMKMLLTRMGKPIPKT